MSALLSDCTKEEMRAVIRFLHSERIQSAKIIRRIQQRVVQVKARSIQSKSMNGKIILKVIRFLSAMKNI